MTDPVDVVGERATVAVEAALTALDAFAMEDAPAPPGVPTDCCGGCTSCQASVAVAAAWPVFLAAVLTYVRDVGDLDALSVAYWLERDYAPPTD